MTFPFPIFALTCQCPTLFPHVLHNSKFLNLEVCKIDFKGEDEDSQTLKEILQKDIKLNQLSGEGSDETSSESEEEGGEGGEEGLDEFSEENSTEE